MLNSYGGKREGKEGDQLLIVASCNESIGLSNIREGLVKEAHECWKKAGGQSEAMKTSENDH